MPNKPNFKTVQAINFVLLIGFAITVFGLALGWPIPKLLVVSLIAALALVRSYRDFSFGGELGRRRLPFQLLLSLVLIFLILRTDPAR